MTYLLHSTLNQQIVSDFLNGRNVVELSLQYNLDVSYISLVLYQEGIHYSCKKVFLSDPGMKNRTSLS